MSKHSPKYDIFFLSEIGGPKIIHSTTQKKIVTIYTQKTMLSNLRQPKHTPYVFKKRSNLKY
jgi:hypothetical protein